MNSTTNWIRVGLVFVIFAPLSYVLQIPLSYSAVYLPTEVTNFAVVWVLDLEIETRRQLSLLIRILFFLQDMLFHSVLFLLPMFVLRRLSLLPVALSEYASAVSACLLLNLVNLYFIFEGAFNLIHIRFLLAQPVALIVMFWIFCRFSSSVDAGSAKTLNVAD